MEQELLDTANYLSDRIRDYQKTLDVINKTTMLTDIVAKCAKPGWEIPLIDLDFDNLNKHFFSAYKCIVIDKLTEELNKLTKEFEDLE